ncbi:MAG: ABC transporter permease, partial [Acidobacteriota bacterium]
LAISLLAVTLAVGLGLLIGSIAGYAGGFADSLLMRLVDVGLSIPRLFLILAVVGLFHPSVLLLILLLGTTGWMDTARLVRAQILSLKTREFIQAARAIGQGVPTILFRHLLPNSIAPVLVEAALSTGNIILLEAALSYLGLGVQPPTASWGNLVSSGRDVLLDGWWISTFPGLAIVLTVVSLNLLGDGLREAFDPQSASGVQPPEGEDRPDSGDSETKRTSAWTVMLPGSMRISRRRISRILGRSAS